MQKIPTIFQRDPANKRSLLHAPHPACGWVFEGKGVATRKYDGTCCLVKDAQIFQRREVKPGKAPPVGFTAVAVDTTTGKTVGWMPCDRSDPSDQWHFTAFDICEPQAWEEGTYELCGPKIQGNPEHFHRHVLLRHACAEILPDCAREFEALEDFLTGQDIEGVVFHHPDGRMGKIKLRDFGLRRMPQ